jgi:hypothetical protein
MHRYAPNVRTSNLRALFARVPLVDSYVVVVQQQQAQPNGMEAYNKMMAM